MKNFPFCKCVLKLIILNGTKKKSFHLLSCTYILHSEVYIQLYVYKRNGQYNYLYFYNYVFWLRTVLFWCYNICIINRWFTCKHINVKHLYFKRINFLNCFTFKKKKLLIIQPSRTFAWCTLKPTIQKKNMISMRNIFILSYRLWHY